MPRVPILRGILPRLARPLLPITSRSPAMPLRTSLVPSFFRSFYTSRTRLTASPSSPLSPSSKEPQTLSARLKLLIKSYGWYALGVYAVLTVLDFGVAFALINLLGADHAAHLAASVKAFFLNLIGRAPPTTPDSPPPQAGGSEGTYAMLVLAYTVHKTLFFPVRVGLTAAVTPRFVNWLGRRGWTGSGGARRAVQEVREKVRRGSRGSRSSSD